MPYSVVDEICRPIIGPSPSFPSRFGILGTSWLELAALSLLSSLGFLVMLHMFASFLRNQQLLTWTKFELFQILGTMIIVVFTVGAIVPGMCTFDMSFLDPAVYPHPAPPYNQTNMYQISENYFSKVVGTGMLTFAYMMFVIKQLNFISKTTWASNPLGVGSVDSPLESMAQVNTIFFYMMSGYVTSFLLLQMQMRMMEYLALASLFYFFPFGIFFRSFEPTRVFGGMLIGLAIAMFLFYPIIMVFNDYLVAHTVFNRPGIPGSLESEMSAAVADANSKTHSGDLPNEKDLSNNLRDPNNGLAHQALPFVANVAGVVVFLLKPVMIYMVAAVVLPVIDFVVLVEITRAITGSFGEEIDVSNLTRLI